MIKKNLLLVTLFLSMNIYAQTHRIEVLGMVCAFCAQGIEKSFSSDENIKDVFVNLENYFVVIESRDGKSIDENYITTIITKIISIKIKTSITQGFIPPSPVIV